VEESLDIMLLVFPVQLGVWSCGVVKEQSWKALGALHL